MEVHVTDETAKKLKDLAATSGRAPEDNVEDALAGYFEKAASRRGTLDSRYDDLKSGRVKPINGEEAFRDAARKGREPAFSGPGVTGVRSCRSVTSLNVRDPLVEVGLDVA
jgi:predicted transcriptional regulator